MATGLGKLESLMSTAFVCVLCFALVLPQSAAEESALQPLPESELSVTGQSDSAQLASSDRIDGILLDAKFKDLHVDLDDEVEQQSNKDTYSDQYKLGFRDGYKKALHELKTAFRQMAGDSSVAKSASQDSESQASVETAEQLDQEDTQAQRLTESKRWLEKSFQALVKEKDWNAGQQAASHAIALNPNSSDAYTNRSWANAELGNLSQAILDASRAIKLNSQNAIAYVNRGYAREKARQDLRMVAQDYRRACLLRYQQACNALKRVEHSITSGKTEPAMTRSTLSATNKSSVSATSSSVQVRPARGKTAVQISVPAKNKTTRQGLHALPPASDTVSTLPKIRVINPLPRQASVMPDTVTMGREIPLDKDGDANRQVLIQPEKQAKVVTQHQSSKPAATQRFQSVPVQSHSSTLNEPTQAMPLTPIGERGKSSTAVQSRNIAEQFTVTNSSNAIQGGRLSSQAPTTRTPAMKSPQNEIVSTEVPSLPPQIPPSNSVEETQSVSQEASTPQTDSQHIALQNASRQSTDLESHPEKNISHLVRQSYDRFQQQDWAAVERLTTRVIALDPDNVMAYVNRSGARAELGQYANALEDCQRALQLDPQHAIAHNNCGYAYEKMGSLRRAVDEYGRACQLGVTQSCQDYERLQE